jgi:dTDP-4-amino-4,6-dideoxygalactose transaminase
MWVRTQLKIGWSDLLAGLGYCLKPPPRADMQAAVEGYFSQADDTIAAYSVRTGFDLLLQALDLKPGDEVIFSALNVKGMVRVVREAGLVPVPVDLDIAHMGPSLERLKRAITPRSKVFVAAHLFGTRLELNELFAFARGQGIVAVEDCAQAFNGKAYGGSPEADVVMFSFGPIKTATALGGALIRVRDPKLCARMRGIEANYPMQPNAKQMKRVRQFMLLKFATSRPVLGAIYRFFRARGKDYEDALADRVRDVAPLKTTNNLRYRPSAAMLALLKRRLERFDEGSLAARTHKGEMLRDLINGAVVLPAQGVRHHDYWVFPLLVSEPKKFIRALREEGFDASDLPRSQHVTAPEDRPELDPKIAAKAMKDLIVVPCYESMPDSALGQLAATIRRIAATVPKRTEV